MHRLTAGIPAERARCVAEIPPSRPWERLFLPSFPHVREVLLAPFAPQTGSLVWGLSSEFQQSSDDLHSRVRFLQLFLGGQIFGDRPWRLSGERVRAIRGVSRGEKLRWNVFFLPVNARARPVRERKRRNLAQGSLRLVPTLFEPPIRVETCAQLNRCSFARQKVRNRQPFCPPRLKSDSKPHP